MPSGEALPGPLLRLLDTLLNKLAGHGLLPDLTGLLQSGVSGVAPVQLAGTQFWVAGSRWLWRYWATHAREGHPEQLVATVRAGARRRGQRAQQRAAPGAEP